MKFVVVIIGFGVMVLMLKYRYQVKQFTGDISFAEKIFGVGGTNTFIVFLAMGIFMGSLMYGLGTLQGLLDAVFGRFF